MRLLSRLSRITGYGALWLAVVLGCGFLGTFLPVLWSIGQPSSSENYGAGLAIMFFGVGGLVVGTLPATLYVMHLSQKNARRS